jgi:hypothetical protein
MKSLKTEIIALCDYASVSREGKLSMNGIFDELRVQKFPGGMARAFLVATVSGAANTQYQVTLKIESENGGKSPLKDLVLNATTSQNGKSNLMVELVNLGFERNGDYYFKIYCEGKEVGSTLLKVLEAGKYHLDDVKLPN